MMCSPQEPIGQGIYAGLSGKNKCDKFNTVLHIYGSCGGNGYCRHCYGVHKAEKQCYGFSNMPVAYNNVGESVSLYCPNCKNPIGQNDIFCKTCGYNLKSTEQVSQMRITCPNCGEENEPDSSFCVKCGSQL